MGLLDVFESDAFNLQSMTAAINKLPYKPGRLGEIRLFENRPSTSRHAVIEEKLGKLSLLPVQARGSQQQTTQSEARRKLRSFTIPHVPAWDALLAEDLEGKRAFGSEDEVEIFSQILNDRLQQMKDNHEATWEWHRMGALHGIVLDNDGSTPIVNFFTEFGITQQIHDVDFTDSGTEALGDPTTNLKTMCAQLVRSMQKQLGGTPFKGIHVLCGNQFWDGFVSHWSVKHAYERYQDNKFARELQVPVDGNPGGFQFGDISWENYRGYVGDQAFIDTDTAIAFPIGTRDIFLEIPAPADFMEAVNTRGQMMYAKQERMKWDKGIELHTQSNVLYMCTRPGCLIKLNGTNLPTSVDDFIS